MRELNIGPYSSRCGHRATVPGAAGAIARGLALSVCIASATAAAAANWTLFAECGDAGQARLYSYDPHSVRKRGEQLYITLRADYSQVASSKSRTARIVWAVDCGGRSFVERSRIEYASTGRIVARYKQPTAPMGINPGSVAEKLFEKVCL